MICVSVGNLPFSDMSAIVSTEELVELRFDLMSEEIGLYRPLFQSKAAIIATCRPSSVIPEEKRKRIYSSAINWGAAYVDLELDMPEPIFQKLKLQGKRAGTKVIGSHHSSSLTPSSEDLKELVEKGRARGCDVIKIVGAASSTDDAIRLLSLIPENEDVVVAATGEFSKIVRFAAPLLGAKFTYAAAVSFAKTAENQPSAEELRELFGLLEGS